MLTCKLNYLIFVLIIIQESSAQQQQKPHDVKTEPYSSSSDEVLCNSTNTTTEVGAEFSQSHATGLKFKLPFFDIEAENKRTVRFLREDKQHELFLLHGNELYQLKLSGKQKELLLLGTLMGKVAERPHLDAEIIHWRDYYIITIALEGYIEVYQIPETWVQSSLNAATNPLFVKKISPYIEPAQQLTVEGELLDLFLSTLRDDRIMLIVAMRYSALDGKIMTLSWEDTFFDIFHELIVPPIQSVHLLESTPKYLIIGKATARQNRTSLNVYEIAEPDMSLHAVQNLIVLSSTYHPFTFQKRNFLMACSANRQKCYMLRMSEGQFGGFKSLKAKESTFQKLVAGDNYLVALRDMKVVLYNNPKLDCYASFTNNQSTIENLLTFSNGQNEKFILLHFQHGKQFLLRIVGIQIEEGSALQSGGSVNAENQNNPSQRHSFEDTIGKLRSLLLKRKRAMEVLGSVSKSSNSQLAKRYSATMPLHIQAGRIGEVKVKGTHLLSPMQLLKRIEQLQAQMIKIRLARSTEQRSNAQMLKVKRLKVDKLIYDGDIVKALHLDKKTAISPVLNAKKKLTTKVLSTEKLITPLKKHIISRQAAASSPSSSANTNNITSPPTVTKVRQLNVQRINNISWTDFYDSLYLRNRDTKIQGRLTFQSTTKAVQLWTPKVNDMSVDEFFNLREPQVVHSNILISRFLLARDLQVERLNGLDFANDIVFSGTEALVESPVEFYHISIAGDIILSNDMRVILRPMGDNFSQLQQNYLGKVIINGTLRVEKLRRENSMAQVVVNEEPFSKEILTQNFLLRNEMQHITKGPMIFGNAKVTTNALSTVYLNSHPVKDHLLNTREQRLEQPLYLAFMSAFVSGDVICRDYNSSIYELHQNVIRYGEVANITGTKYFQAPLTVNIAMTSELNVLPVHELVLRTQLRNSFAFNNTKSFDNIIVMDSAQVENALNATNLNNLPLSEFLNYDYHLNSLYLPFKLISRNIVFHRINDLSFDELFAKFDTRGQQLVLHKDLLIEGNVKFEQNLLLQFVNDVAWDPYVESVVRVNENAIIQGRKRFSKGLILTKSLYALRVNDLNLAEIFQNILSKSRPQLITGSYTFNDLRLSNVDVSIVNDVCTASFIDTRLAGLEFDGDIVMPKVNLLSAGSIEGNFANELKLEELMQRLLRLPQLRSWRNLSVLGNAYWNSIPNSGSLQHDQLQYLYINAVRRSADQTITGNIKLHRPLIRDMTTNTTFPSNVNFDFIAKDSLLRNASSPQLVKSTKLFLRPLYALSVVAERGLQAWQINEIDVLRFNASLYRVSSGAIIYGPLKFNTAPIFESLHVLGYVNGVNVSLSWNLAIMPPLRLNNLTISTSLQLGDVNDVNLNGFLMNRVTKNSTALAVGGVLTFEHLILNERAMLHCINEIPIDNLVWKKSKNLQVIYGEKKIDGALLLAGPVHVLHLNGHDLVESYQQSISKKRNYNFDVLSLSEATFEGGVVF